MITREEYGKKWESYLANLSGQISELDEFESEVRSKKRIHVSPAWLKDCEENTLTLHITRHDAFSHRTYMFVLESCPFCAYQVFELRLSPSLELMERNLCSLLTLISDVGLVGNQQNMQVKDGRTLVYVESVYLDDAKVGWQEMMTSPPLHAKTVTQDINSWVSVAERALASGQRLNFDPILLLGRLRSINPVPLSILEDLEKVVIELSANPYKVIEHWAETKFSHYPSYNPI
jgi:hypothetical protein